jgi:hypothetical protein
MRTFNVSVLIMEVLEKLMKIRFSRRLLLFMVDVNIEPASFEMCSGNICVIGLLI